MASMPRILIADDDPAQLRIRQMLLEAAGHQVDIAINARHAMHRLATVPADLLMMDLKFPNAEGKADAEEGLALIRYTREHAPGLPVIVLSGWPQEMEGRPEARMVSRVAAGE